jgi:hypothetical protein
MMSTTMSRQAPDLTALTARTTASETRLSAAEARTTALETQQAATETRPATLETRQTTTETLQTASETRITTIENRAERLADAVSVHATSFHWLKRNWQTVLGLILTSAAITGVMIHFLRWACAVGDSGTDRASLALTGGYGLRLLNVYAADE